MKKFRKPDSRGPRPQGRGGPPFKGPPRPAIAAPKGRAVVGIHAVKELLKVRPRAITQFSIRENYESHPDLAEIYEIAEKNRVRITITGDNALNKITTAHQGVVAFTEDEPEANWAKIAKKEKSIVLALDEVEDPHNLGAVLRTGWLFGVDAVLTPEHRSAHLSPAVSKVAQGAAEHVPVERESALPERLKQLKDEGYWILGLSHKAKQSLYQLEVPEKVVWVLGSEASGLRKSVEGACDDLISIPQANPEASYNVSVAAAIAVSETYRQHQSQSLGT